MSVTPKLSYRLPYLSSLFFFSSSFRLLLFLSTFFFLPSFPPDFKKNRKKKFSSLLVLHHTHATLFFHSQYEIHRAITISRNLCIKTPIFWPHPERARERESEKMFNNLQEGEKKNSPSMKKKDGKERKI